LHTVPVFVSFVVLFAQDLEKKLKQNTTRIQLTSFSIHVIIKLLLFSGIDECQQQLDFLISVYCFDLETIFKLYF